MFLYINNLVGGIEFTKKLARPILYVQPIFLKPEEPKLVKELPQLNDCRTRSSASWHTWNDKAAVFLGDLMSLD